ncbi:NYN domain-containing protein [Bradyrhizobium sp. Ai1a-2]|uniref:NYN domain-containing protein n=1 Tax=Bradyrhizobium sp. Ai1a-2 TaxID=196490 RepID=UPI001362D920|nr:NYN domain-containing protein [Bradyrhizobium sp. Ai1a-2]
MQTQVYERNAGNKEKKVDVAIAITMMEDAYIVTKDNDDILPSPAIPITYQSLRS